jgi:hypothetical protein
MCISALFAHDLGCEFVCGHIEFVEWLTCAFHTSTANWWACGCLFSRLFHTYDVCLLKTGKEPSYFMAILRLFVAKAVNSSHGCLIARGITTVL